LGPLASPLASAVTRVRNFLTPLTHWRQVVASSISVDGPVGASLTLGTALTPSSALPTGRALTVNARLDGRNAHAFVYWSRLLVVASATAAATSCIPPSWAASALLHPTRRAVERRPSSAQDAEFTGVGISLRGWRFRAAGEKRGSLVYLHGVADNRTSAIGVAERFTRRGFDVVAYDSRAHGESDGHFCTYGYYERADLSRVLDTIASRPIVVMGASLGGAVALQTAAEDSRVAAVVAAETFSDLSTVVRERTRFFLRDRTLREALAIAEQRGSFRVADVSPVNSAARIRVPVLLIHGARDTATSPEHSRRVYDALRTTKRFILVPDVGHNQSLNGAVWQEIEEWIDATLR
jgi:uncharacterized protein